jgi:diguanylate cyclase (GGDEF)-like protein
MLTIYNCITTAHDLRLVALAAATCAIASFTAINLLRHARGTAGGTRLVWLAISAVSTGFGIWATHFVAMLAFAPDIPSGYNIVLTVVSLVAAILLTGAGLAVSLLPNWRPAPWIGGAIVAVAIAAMHYTGMAAFDPQASLTWSPAFVVASILSGAALAALALPLGLHGSQKRGKIGGALLLTLAICSLHFTGMSAVTIIPNPAATISTLSIPAGWLAIGVALISFAIIGLALAATIIDIHDRRRSELEADRMRGLANAAVEGLLVCDGDTIVTVNTSFADLAGSRARFFTGLQLQQCFPDEPSRRGLTATPDQPIELSLRHCDGTMIPVQIILRRIDFAGRPHQVVAVRDLRARNEARKRMRYLAHHDTLTSLPNRGFFTEHVDQAIAALQSGDRLAVLSINLDRFKEVNDLLGYAAGDRLLQDAASRIAAALDNDHMVARLGSDEFAVLMNGVVDAAAAVRLAEKILVTLGAANGATEPRRIAASIGIALCRDDAADRETLLARAEMALNRAKTDGGATCRMFETGMGDAARDRLMLENDLRHAIGGGEMSLVYQPQESLGGVTIGFEALLRWDHPTRGAVRPDVFIPIAEDSGTIVGIGEWVLRTACAEAATWKRPLTIAVNVSAVQIYHDGFVQMVHQVLLETGLPASRLELEITETALIRDFNRALSALRRVKALGVHIAMDDFGTGYSSLSNLSAFPFDKIKIDRSFIKAINSNRQAAAIVRAVLVLGRGLALPVLAEGVETEAELQFLRDEHCDEVQGYLLGRPATIDRFRHLTDGAGATRGGHTMPPRARSA